MVVLPSGALEIDEVRPSDRGNYRCNVSSLQQHRVSPPAQLSIDTDEEAATRLAAPKFIATPQSVAAPEGSNVTLDCAANGFPTPWITWLKDGSSIDLADLDSRFIKVGTGSLQISRLQEKDRGTYQCRADNRADSVDAAAAVDVHVPPRFVKRPLDRFAFEKEDIELECSVYGRPQPAVYWMKNGDPIPQSEYMQMVNGNNLKILGLMSMDAGIFQCIASNAAGNIQASAQLSVLQPGSFVSSTHHLNPHANTLEVDDTFDDDGTDDDDDYDDDDYDDEDDEDGEELPLLRLPPLPPAPPPDAAVAPVRDAPSAPEGLSAVVVSTRFVTLSWRPPANPRGEIQTYSVYYRKDGSPRERVLNTTRAQLEEANISNLLPDRLYHFRVLAHNEQGAGASSETLTVRTDPEARVLGPPRLLTVLPAAPHTLAVRWLPPVEAPAGPPQGYRLFYMEEGSVEEHHVEAQGTGYNLTGLQPFTEYIVWVVGFNANGQGSSTEEVTARTLSAPPSEPPQNVTLEATSSSSILVRWEPPPREGSNGLITGYKLRFRKRDRGRGRGGGGAGGGGGEPTTLSTPGDRRVFALTSLERGVTYQIRLWAMNVNGTGPPTEWFTMDTFENDLDESTVPDSPHGLKARPMVDTITVSWSPPRNQNIMVRGYTIGWGKGIPDVYTKLLDGKQRYYVIENLEPTSEYVISLRAYNEMGDGRPVYTSVRTLDNVAPEPATPLVPPVGLMAIVLSARSVVLYWTDTTLSKNQHVTDSRHYVVRYTSQHHAPNPRYKYFNSTDLNCMIDDLRPNTQYEFTVKTVRGRRESPWSMVVLNMTQEDRPYSQPRDLTVVPVAENPTVVNMNWQPPKQPNGPITGYIILYTTDMALTDRDWVVEGILGDRMTTAVKGLTPDTVYYFKIQARNGKGYGPFSNVVHFTTGPSVGPGLEESAGVQQRDGRGIATVTIMYIVIGCSVLVCTALGALSIIVCCKRRSAEHSKKGYMKGVAKGKPGKQNIKPPDLWIHHDQMELKALQQQSGGSAGGPSGLGGDPGGPSGVPATLPRAGPPGPGAADFDQEHHDGGGGGSKYHSNSLDKRGYVSSYIGSDEATATARRIIKPKPVGSGSGAVQLRESISAAAGGGPGGPACPPPGADPRPLYPRTQYSMSRAHVTLDPGPGPPEAGHGGPVAAGGGYALHPGSAAGYEPVVSVGPGQALLATAAPYGPGLQAAAAGAGGADAAGGQGTLGKRTQGHPLKSFSVPAPPPQSAPSTPQQKHVGVSSVTIRPQATCSPYKKAGHLTGGGGSGTNTPPLGPPAAAAGAGGGGVRAGRGPTPEHPHLQPSYSTEELNQEMANLEGLMKDLNAITASEFEC